MTRREVPEQVEGEAFERARIDHIYAAKVTKHNLGVIGPLAHRDPATTNLIWEAILDTQIAIAESSRIVALAAVLSESPSRTLAYSTERESLVNELRDLLGFIEFTEAKG